MCQPPIKEQQEKITTTTITTIEQEQQSKSHSNVPLQSVNKTRGKWEIKKMKELLRQGERKI